MGYELESKHIEHMILITLPFVFLAGLCLGSFLNVVIYRMPLSISVVMPRSQCPQCKKTIAWYYNIPLLSYLILRGKCAYCKTPISIRYPVVELLTGILITITVYINNNWYLLPFEIYFISALVCSTFIDLDHWIIPDKITLSGIVIGFVGSFLHAPIPFYTAEATMFIPYWIISLAGILFGGGILLFIAWLYYALAKKDGIGGGDIKFLAFVGAFLGAKGALITLIMSSVLGSFIGIFLILFRGKKGGSAIPFGPFLSLGALCAFLFGEQLWRWYFHL